MIIIGIEKLERATFIVLVYVEKQDEDLIMTLVNEPEEMWETILLTYLLGFYND